MDELENQCEAENMMMEMSGESNDLAGTNSQTTDLVCPEVSSKEDQADAKAIATLFREDSQPCCQKYKCNKIIPEQLAVQHRQNFMELDKGEQDLVIIAHLQSQRHLKELNAYYGSRTIRKSAQTTTDNEYTRQLVEYKFAGLKICQKMYYFLYNLSKKRYQNLVQHYDNSGLMVRTHKSKNVVSKRCNVLKLDDVQGIIQFISSYGDQFVSSLPGRFPGCKDLNAIRLPSHETKNAIYNKYCNAVLESLKLKPLAFSTFTEVWRKHCPNVVISEPSSDLCDKVTVKRSRIKKSGAIVPKKLYTISRFEAR